MSKSILLVFFFLSIYNLSFTQKNRFSTFFNSIDSIHGGVNEIAKLQYFKKRNKLNLNEKIDFYNKITLLSSINQKYNLLLKYSHQGLKMAQRAKIDSLVSFYTMKIGSSYYFLNQRDRAEYYFRKSYVIAKQCGNWLQQAKTLNNLGAIYVEKLQYGKAENCLLKSINLYKARNLLMKQGLLPYRLLATLYSSIERYDEAETIYLETLKSAQSMKDTTLICYTLMYYSNLLAETGKIKKAVDLGEEALSYQKIQKNKTNTILVLRGLGDLYNRNKQFDKATEVYRHLLAVNKEVFVEDLNKKVADTEVKYKTAEIKRQKELAESKTLAEKRKRNLYVFFFLGVIILLVITFLLVYVSQQNKRRKSEIQLQKQLIESVVKAQEEEKVRMARDLHDGICQKFAATKMKFSTISSDLAQKFPELNSKYKAAISLLDDATNELRGISHQIMPPALDNKDLISALKQLSQQTFSDQILYTFEVFGKAIELSENEQINIYRIAQELFANIIKHAFATEVSVQLIFTDSNFSLMVEDNGIGIAEEKSNGIGLKNLRIRAEIIQAKLLIERGHEKGTFCSLTLAK